MKEVLKVKNVSKTYQALNGEVEAIKDITFDINERRIRKYNWTKWMW